jgi:hypothetical protein
VETELRDSFTLELESGYALTASLVYGFSSFCDGPWSVGVAFIQPGGSAASGIALSELLSEDFWGRRPDGGLSLVRDGHQGPDRWNSHYSLTVAEKAPFLAWLRAAVEGVPAPGPRLRASALAA